MKRASLAIVPCLLSCAGAPREEPADLVLRNGNIVTVDETNPSTMPSPRSRTM